MTSKDFYSLICSWNIRSINFNLSASLTYALVNFIIFTRIKGY